MMTSLVSLRLAHSLLTLECGLTALLYLHSPSILFNHSVPGRGIICSSDEIIIQARQYDLQWLVAALLSFEAAITLASLSPQNYSHIGGPTLPSAGFIRFQSRSLYEKFSTTTRYDPPIPPHDS